MVSFIQFTATYIHPPPIIITNPSIFYSQDGQQMFQIKSSQTKQMEEQQSRNDILMISFD